jgi:hypothetical protein
MHNFVILYAYDILLSLPLPHLSTNSKECILLAKANFTLHRHDHKCKKSCCLRIEPQFEGGCSNVNAAPSNALPWVKALRYLDIYMQSVHDHSNIRSTNAERSFRRSLNAKFGIVGRIASEEVTLQLVNSKFLPAVSNCLEACH